MALIACPECNHSVSSKATSCPFCGCPIESSYVEVISLSNKDCTDVIKLIDMAQSALNGQNGQEAYDYANKVLEIAPQHLIGLNIKMKALDLLGTLANPRVLEIIECGSQILSVTPPKQIEKANLEIYSFYLGKAQILLSLAITRIKDTDDIKRTFSQLCLITFSAASQASTLDAPYVKICENLATSALQLKLNVPDQYIHDFYHYQAENLAASYKTYTEELQKRYKIYGASLAESALQARKIIFDSFRNGMMSENELRQKAEKRRNEYWMNHPVEKAEIEQSISIYTDSLKKLQDECSHLGIFNIKRKKELQTEIENLQKQLSDLREELEKDR